MAGKPAVRSARQMWFGCGIAVLIMAGMAAMLAATGGWMNQGYGLAFFVSSALVSGILFWTLTPAPDAANTVTWHELGARLTGGAAIGLVFAFAAWMLVPPDTVYVVVKVPVEAQDQALQVTAGDGVESAELTRSRHLVVELLPRTREGQVQLTWFDESLGAPVVKVLYTVDRKGGIRREKKS